MPGPAPSCCALVHRDAARAGRPPEPGCRSREPSGVPRPPGRLARSLQHPGRPAGCLHRAGFDWVTSHVFRKTVATLMDHAGLSSRAAADQLGHANTSMTTDVYFGRKIVTTGAAAVLEALNT